MKPRNAEQRAILSFSKQLPPISKEQKQYAFDTCLYKFAQISRKTIYCLECGEKWKPEKITHAKKVVCPHCHETLHARKQAVKEDREYFAIVTTFTATHQNVYQINSLDAAVFENETLQVTRMFWVNKTMKKYTKPSYHISEVMQHWQNDDGKCITIEKATNNMAHQYDQWQHYSQLEFRSHSHRQDMRVKLEPFVVYPECDALPIFKRNGFNGKFHGHAPHLFFHKLLHSQRFETMVKAKQSTLVNYYRFEEYITWRYWDSVKICIRNNYNPPDVSLWIDYLDLLKHFNKDIRNPHYVCLKKRELKRAHDRLLKKKQAIEEHQRITYEREQQLQELKRMKEAQPKYEECMGKFFNMKLKAGRLIIVPLKSIDEFKQEGDALSHCIFSNKYYEKKNSLILSARINNKPVETIELSLKNFEVIQARGKHNQTTKHHDQIVSLVNDNIGLIAQMNTA